MVLTPLIIGDQKTATYINFYKNSHKYKILDNGAFEMEKEGVGCNFYDVINAANVIQANEIILTDYLYECGKTINAIYNCIRILDKKDLKGKFILHAVVQGNNKEEWMDCFDKLMAIDEIDVIGLSKLSVPKCFGLPDEKNGPVAKSRVQAINYIINSGLYKIEKDYLRKNAYRGKRIHLLGGDNWTSYELMVLSKYPFIRSIDTSMPIWYGLHRKSIDINSGKCKEFLDKVNLFTSQEIVPEINICILHNLLVTHKFSKSQAEVIVQ